MNTIKLLLCLMACCASASAQVAYHDASVFPLLGKATQHTLTRYERLPDSLQHISRPQLWNLGRNSAGLAVRFRSNSTIIKARWETRNDYRMNHMTPTGICGLDLYYLNPVNGKWTFAGSGRPSGKLTEATIVSNMEPQEREYILFLPLYDGPTMLQIGIDSTATIAQPAVDLPRRQKPVVFYGTSILQGGCASRPGMAHTNILQRWLNRECINLGFSGNGRLDPEIAEVMATVDASVYVLDYAPNATVEQMKERAQRFYDIIRARHPHAPILFVEDPRFPHHVLDKEIDEEISSRNATLHDFYNSLKQKGETNIYLLSSEHIIGEDGEATVDGIHFTDLGFMRYAETLLPLLSNMMGE